jgi:beta-glucuronidase
MSDTSTEAAGEGAPVTRREALSALGVAGAAAAAISAAPASAAASPQSARQIPSLLYPHESATRSRRDLSGLWRFRLDPQDLGERERWFDGLQGGRMIPVPSSWNDLFDDAQNHFGPAWYETEVWVAPEERGRRLVLRFGSASYHARVWLNGVFLGEHQGGHLPFAFDVTGIARPDGPNRLVVRVENDLRLDRVPAVPDVRTAHFYQDDYPQTTYDFFPYAGLDRPVLLCSVPEVHLRDLTVRTSFSGRDGVVRVDLEVAAGWSGEAVLTLEGAAAPVTVRVPVRQGRGEGELRVPAARAWSPQDPFLHRLTVTLASGGARLDEYHLKIGIRTVEVRGSQILLNGEPVFLKGFGKHEDFPIHGKGLDLPVLVRDFELLKWVGANSFRTSHYPYAEEALMLADEAGFLVIAETPGVSLVFMDPPEVIEARYQALAADLEALIARDKNHPSVILWSLANEPIPKPFHTTNEAPEGAVAAGQQFFARLFARARELDRTRPVALVSVQGGPPEWVGQGDVICTNSYNGWYAVSGRLDAAADILERQIAALRAHHGDKPIIFTEFGADAVAGAHSQPPVMWTEDYQAELIALYWRVLRQHPYVVGAHPWAFADFKTPQSIMRVEGLNQKGVFTRDRRPKLAARRLRELWTAERT